MDSEVQESSNPYSYKEWLKEITARAISYTSPPLYYKAYNEYCKKVRSGEILPEEVCEEVEYSIATMASGEVYKNKLAFK